VLVHPENVFEIMRALHRVLLDQVLREKMKQRSYRQAAKFSWDKSVCRIIEAYREVLEPLGSQTRSPEGNAKAGVA
jgi:glycosyltransferase involved in cell wall biosynthesis